MTEETPADGSVAKVKGSLFGSAKVVRTRENTPSGSNPPPIPASAAATTAPAATTTAALVPPASQSAEALSSSDNPPPDSAKLWNDGRNMTTAMSLRERMKTYQALRAEAAAAATQEVEPSSADAAAGAVVAGGGASSSSEVEEEANSFMGPAGTAAIASRSLSIPEEEGAEPQTRDMEPPDESWVPPPPPPRDEEEGADGDRELVAAAAVGAAATGEEEYEEEEVEEVEDVEEFEDEDDDDDYEEVEVSAQSARALAAVGDEDTADEEQGVFGALDDDDDVPLDDEQEVFDALEEASLADRAITYNDEPAQQERALPAEPPVYKPIESSQAVESNNSKQNCIIAGILLVGAMAIVAIVLPFVLDYNNRDTSGGPTPTMVPSPTAAPIAPTPTAPVAPGVPTLGPGETSSPTNTPAPSSQPTTQRFGQFLEAFLIPISGEEVFQDTSSPQYRAAVFISEDDPFTSELTSVEQLEDRYASVTFYYATNGDSWFSCYFNDTSCTEGEWLLNDVCLWNGVGCTEDGRISSIVFAEDNGLQGTLPLETFLLSELTDLIIANNTLEGELPVVFGENATAMRSLVLPGNQMAGDVPNDYLVNSPLEIVVLEDNGFSGPIPTNLGNGTSLLTLDLSGNQFTGNIPQGVGDYESLIILDLSNNALNGAIPESIFRLTELGRLHLNNNPLSGSLSPQIRNLTFLEEIRIGNSDMTGFIPDEIVTLRNLVELDMSGAQFQGQLPQGIGTLAEPLRILRVDTNQLVGTVPTAYGLLNNLNVMTLNGNGFTGSIAESICQLRGDGPTSLRVLTADCDELECPCCSECF